MDKISSTSFLVGMLYMRRRCTDIERKMAQYYFSRSNIHHWTGFTKFHVCCHAPLSTEKQRKKNWLSPTSESFKALQDILFSNSILKYLSYLTKFSHTGTLEVYHSLYNRWLPKSIHFSFHGMIARTQLAILDFNSGSNLNQATTKEGKKRYNASFSKMTATWSAKSIKQKKSDKVLQKLIFRTEERVFKNLQ